MSEIAFRTTHPLVLETYQIWKEEAEKIRRKRIDLVDILGRNAYVNRGNGFGSTRITGFERFESDKDGDLISIPVSNGTTWELMVSSKRGQHNGLIVPNLRRKAGKEFAEELEGYTSPGLDLDGIATFHVYTGAGGMYAGGPSVTVWGGVMYALCQSVDWPVDLEIWESIPLSVYYAAKEEHEPKEDPS